MKFVGRVLPWPRLNHLMDLAEAMNTQASRVYEAKKRLLESGDDLTAKQVGEGKDLISLLSMCSTAMSMFSPMTLMWPLIVQGKAAVSEDDRLSEEEVVAQMMYAPVHLAF